MFRIWRWSALREKWVEVRYEAMPDEPRVARELLKWTLGWNCPTAVEWLAPKSEREQLALLERMTQ